MDDSIARRIRNLETTAGMRLPELIRQRLIMQLGVGAVWWQDDPNREVVLYGLDRLEEILPMFREAWGSSANGVIVIGHVMGGVSRIGMDRHGRVLDLLGGPESWRPLAPSMEEFLDRVERDGVDWIGQLT